MLCKLQLILKYPNLTAYRMSEELYSFVQTLSSFFTRLNNSYNSKFLVLTAIEKGFRWPRKNGSG